MRAARAWVRKNDRTKELHPSRQKWEVIYEDPAATPPYKQRTKGGFPNKAAAEKWAQDHRTKTERGEYIVADAGKVTFNALGNEWLSNTPFDRAHTAHDYNKYVNGRGSRLNQRFGQTPIGDITFESVRLFVKDLSQTLAPQTVRHYFYALRTVLDYGVETGRILTNPARRYKVKHLPSPKKMAQAEDERYPLTTAETAAIIAHLPAPYDTFTRLVAATGMRPEEAAALKLADIDTTEGTVAVRAVLVEVNGKLHREKFTKTPESRRLIDLDTATLAHLTAYIADHRARALQFFSAHPEHANPGDDLPLFVGVVVGGAHGRPLLDRLDYSKPMRYSAFNRKHWAKALAAAGVPSQPFYNLRHAHASLLVDRIGQPGALTLKEIQERLGHGSAVMTLDRYARTGRPDRERRRSALADALTTTDDSNVTPITRKRSG